MINWTFTFEAIKAIASAVAVVGGIFAAASFYYFRRRFPKLSMNIVARHLVADGATHLYVVVEVTNLDSVKIQGKCCTLAVRACRDGRPGQPAADVQAIPPSGVRFDPQNPSVWSIPQGDEDTDRIWVLDQGETNTFCFVATLNELDLFACLLQADYHSRKITWLSPPAFGWRRDQLYVLADADQAGSRSSKTQPAAANTTPKS